MKLKYLFSKSNIVFVLCVIGVVSNSIAIGYFIGVDSTERGYDLSLIPVDVVSMDSLWFVDFYVLSHRTEETHSLTTSYENNTIYFSATNATILKIEIVIAVEYYFFRIYDEFYTYIKFDNFNLTSFAVCNIDFWYLLRISPGEMKENEK